MLSGWLCNERLTQQAWAVQALHSTKKVWPLPGFWEITTKPLEYPVFVYLMVLDSAK